MRYTLLYIHIWYHGTHDAFWDGVARTGRYVACCFLAATRHPRRKLMHCIEFVARVACTAGEALVLLLSARHDATHWNDIISYRIAAVGTCHSQYATATAVCTGAHTVSELPDLKAPLNMPMLPLLCPCRSFDRL